MYPRPLSEPTNSPTTAPISASVIATFSPLKKKGSAIGKRTFTKVFSWLVRYERLRSRSSSGVAANPVAVSTTIGKKATRKATTSFDASPCPSTSRSTGAIATLGTDCVTTISG